METKPRFTLLGGTGRVSSHYLQIYEILLPSTKVPALPVEFYFVPHFYQDGFFKQTC